MRFLDRTRVARLDATVIYLSYILTMDTPLYGNGKGISISPDKNIIDASSFNTMNFSFPNHSGTHIDFPYHFDTEGKTLSDYPADFWVFNSVELVDVSGLIEGGQMVEPSMFPKLVKKDIDLLLIKTGYGKYRGSDRYTLSPPGISSDVADWVRKNYPTVRCVGMDLISVSSYSNRGEGRKAHRSFLAPESGYPILLIEDMMLDYGGPFEKVIVAPLLVEGADGSPCTVLAFPS